MDDREQRRASFQAFKRIDGAFKAGDLEALRAAIGDPPEFPNVRAPHDAINCSLLQYAIYHSPLPFIRTLLELGADPNYDDLDGFPSIMAALSCRPQPGSPGRSDIAEVVAMLLEFGADPNQRGINDYTPLHFVAALGDIATVELLLAKGADPTLRTRIDEYETPAEAAEVAGHAELAARLKRAEDA